MVEYFKAIGEQTIQYVVENGKVFLTTILLAMFCHALMEYYVMASEKVS